jgi:hypothetical protein
MPEKTIPMVNDQTGQQKAVPVKEVAERQGQGWRALDPRAYDDAMLAQAEEAGDEIVEPMAQQGADDAAMLSAVQYPEAQPSGEEGDRIKDVYIERAEEQDRQHKAEKAAQEQQQRQSSGSGSGASGTAAPGAKPVPPQPGAKAGSGQKPTS